MHPWNLTNVAKYTENTEPSSLKKSKWSYYSYHSGLIWEEKQAIFLKKVWDKEEGCGGDCIVYSQLDRFLKTSKMGLHLVVYNFIKWPNTVYWLGYKAIHISHNINPA